MEKSKNRSILLFVVAILFLINVGCTSETNVPQESSEKTSVLPSGTADVADDKAAMAEAKVTDESGERTPGQMMETTLEQGDDAAITGRVKAALLENPLTRGLDTNVETKGGVVTLSGQVKDAAEMETVANFVKDLPGVNNVVNNMTIE
jgi:osmotically-inducible protein OsmY